MTRSLALWITALLLVPCAAARAEEAPAPDVNHGARLYSDLCVSCHGRYGRGDGPLAPSLQRPLPDFADSSWTGGRTDAQIVAGLAEMAHGSMAIANLLGEQELRDAVAYINRLSVPGQKVSLLQGRDIYQASCWVCHGRTGQGDGPAMAGRTGPPARDFTDPEFEIAGREDEIARAIALGPEAAFHGSPLMPEWASRLTPQQIDDVVAYLKTFKNR
jgi:mono/diheme cytochrome c family protein